MNKIKFSITIEPELNLALQAEAINQETSKSEIVRLALKRYLGIEPDIFVIDQSNSYP